MADEPRQEPQTQKTREGLEIPVPRPEAIKAFFRKVIKASGPDPDEQPPIVDDDSV